MMMQPGEVSAAFLRFNCPFENDVVCAKGKKYYMHRGNQQFRSIVDQNLERYISAPTRNAKSEVVNEILRHMRDRVKSRFVRQDANGRWFDIGDNAAREKIGMFVRDQVLRQDPEKIKIKRKRRAAQKAKRAAKATSPQITTSNQPQNCPSQSQQHYFHPQVPKTENALSHLIDKMLACPDSTLEPRTIPKQCFLANNTRSPPDNEDLFSESNLKALDTEFTKQDEMLLDGVEL